MSNRFFTSSGESVFDAVNWLNLFDLGEIKSRNKTLQLHQKKDIPQEIIVKGPVETLPQEILRVCEVFGNLKYQVFRSDHKNYNLSIVSLRNDCSESNRFDDEMWVFWRFEGKWTFKKYKITTDPGLTYLEDPIDSSGTTILKEGQYLGAFRPGKHKGLYDALVQTEPVTVIRDLNHDNKLDFASGKEQNGFFGINIHRSSPTGQSQFVNKWSAGCQVFANITQYNEFIDLCKKLIGDWGNSFSYSLIRKDQLK